MSMSQLGPKEMCGAFASERLVACRKKKPDDCRPILIGDALDRVSGKVTVFFSEDRPPTFSNRPGNGVLVFEAAAKPPSIQFALHCTKSIRSARAKNMGMTGIRLAQRTSR